LWVEGPQPIEYTRYCLMKQFHWTPDQVRSIPLPDLLQIFACQRIEAEVAERRNGS